MSSAGGTPRVSVRNIMPAWVSRRLRPSWNRRIPSTLAIVHLVASVVMIVLVYPSIRKLFCMGIVLDLQSSMDMDELAREEPGCEAV